MRPSSGERRCSGQKTLRAATLCSGDWCTAESEAPVVRPVAAQRLDGVVGDHPDALQQVVEGRVTNDRSELALVPLGHKPWQERVRWAVVPHDRGAGARE